MHVGLVCACQIISCSIVALGQNTRYSWCGPLAAAFAFALHWKSLDHLPFKKTVKVSFVWFLAIQLVQLSWMTDTYYQGLYILGVYLAVSLLVAWQFAFFSKKLRQCPLQGKYILALSSLWVLMEWVRLYFLCGFAFNMVGLSLSCHLLSLQFASLWGVLGLSFWVILTNILALRFFRLRSSTKYFCLWFAVAFFPYFFGFFHIRYHETKAQEMEFHQVLLVQPGLLPSQKYRLTGKEKDYIDPFVQWRNVLKELSLQVEKKIDLIVLPEACFPLGFDRFAYPLDAVQKEFMQIFGEKISSFFPPLVEPFGKEDRKKVSNAYFIQTVSSFFRSSVMIGLDTEEGEKNYNSAFFFEPGKLPKRYDKRILLPLAEYIPFEGLKALSAKYGIHGFFTCGKQAKVFGEQKISPCICYEELFPGLMREGKSLGAKVFVNLSNDGWFPFSSLNKQHFFHGMLRSIENGTPLVRCCSTGITAVVDSLGRVISYLPENKKGSLYVRLPKYSYKTGFALWGDFPLIFISSLFLCLFLIKIQKQHFEVNLN